MVIILSLFADINYVKNFFFYQFSLVQLNTSKKKNANVAYVKNICCNIFVDLIHNNMYSFLLSKSVSCVKISLVTHM